MVAYLFAGQGSQYVGMGKDLYESFPESKAVFDTADRTLGFPLSKLCFEGPAEDLTKTQNCQPAILTVSIAAWAAFKSSNRYTQNVKSYTAGLSLGEYSSLVASEALSFEDAVYLVRRRGEFMEEEALRLPGKMASILGLDLEAVKKICLETGAEIANLNSPGQIVISGGIKEIENAAALAEKTGAKRAILLEVSGAFHSSLMKGASDKLAKVLEKINVKAPKTVFISNVSARPAVSPDEIKGNLIKQVASNVLWEDSMKFILSQGVLEFLEFGPGKVLKGLMRRINPEAKVSNIEKKEDIISEVKNAT
ncbi:MAG: ACP S-malonyltransferase [Candidatus Omnitrophica bacterium]|nr:ACP S-malonyltransferase [Candidatus Omnitrophota bacterium]